MSSTGEVEGLSRVDHMLALYRNSRKLLRYSHIQRRALTSLANV